MKLFWNEPGRRKRRRVWKRYAGMGTADPAGYNACCKPWHGQSMDVQIGGFDRWTY